LGRHLVVALGDMHAGSTLAPCPVEGLELDDGGRYVPSKLQRWLYKCWVEAIDRVEALLQDGDTLHLVCNGDMVDGDHHRTPQIASPLTGIHLRCAHELLRIPLALNPATVHVIRGTESHVGRSGEVEEGLARVIKEEGFNVIGDPDTGTASTFWRRMDLDGVRLDFRHHGRMGQRAYTKASYHRLYAFDIWAEHAMDGERPPDIAVRSHHHQYMDSGRDPRLPTRVVTLPAWQALTAYGHRLAIESLSDIGLVVIVIEGGEADVKPILFRRDRPAVVKP